MKQICCVILFMQILLISCNNKDVTIFVYNNTDNLITDISIYVQGKKFKLENIEPRKKKGLRIQKNEIQLNSRDFRIETTLENRDKIPLNGFYYSDLPGGTNMRYNIDVYDTKILIR